ncbi:hypothetical protein ALVIN_66 [Mycobacterium phage Alvin]|uniref:hypothetical protein n=1 Tax=Mycobacterium phage Alvin TaxID=1567466 RepID=UPI000588E3F9|nr:hypothetical protein ALVIN_66 [Mycobacterium phage Alvin]AJD82570.1 hypothetical protein ALVIN_66 [Mycobacterium phage Alvin]
MTDKVRDELAGFVIRAQYGSPGQTTAEIVDAILEKFDVTEKPEPPAPFGTVRVSASSNGRSINVFINNGDGTWTAIFHDKGHGEGYLSWSTSWTGPDPGDKEVFRP